jgi:hypothetical protein
MAHLPLQQLRLATNDGEGRDQLMAESVTLAEGVGGGAGPARLLFPLPVAQRVPQRRCRAPDGAATRDRKGVWNASARVCRGGLARRMHREWDSAPRVGATLAQIAHQGTGETRMTTGR